MTVRRPGSSARKKSSGIPRASTAGFLRKVDIFSLLDVSEVQSIIPFINSRDAKRGELLFKEGDEGNELYIVKSGRVAVTVRLQNGSEHEIAEFRNGDFFGEMSIFDDAPRSASCATKEKSRLFTLHEKDFFGVVKNHPYIAIKLMYRMLNITTQRLRDTSEFLADMVQWGEKARKRAITDELTGVYNRRFLDDALEDHLERARRTGKPLSMIMIDLDYFREINELYGHAVGDQVIVDVSSVFKRCLTASDIIARYGGDEFTILLPDTSLQRAGELAETIRLEVEKLPLLEQKQGAIKKVTTSQGVSSYPERCSDLKMLREKADGALYSAKEQGRNRVVIAT